MSPILRSKILWKVYLAWFLKKILPLLVLEILILGVAIFFFARYVFIAKVVDNALLNAVHNPLQIFSFMFFAFLATSWLKKIVVVVFLGLGVLLLGDLGRVLTSARTTARATKPN